MLVLNTADTKNKTQPTLQIPKVKKSRFSFLFYEYQNYLN